MAEWSIAAVLKTVEPRGSRGSNPCLSAEPTEQNKRVSGQKPTNRGCVGFLLPISLVSNALSEENSAHLIISGGIFRLIYISAGNLRQVDLQKYRSRPTDEIMG